jgi:signal transduction histidine kinase
VSLKRQGDVIELLVSDDGIGFDPVRHAATRNGTGGIGLLSMRERAIFVGGTLVVKSIRRLGTEVEIRIPLPKPAIKLVSSAG